MNRLRINSAASVRSIINNSNSNRIPEFGIRGAGLSSLKSFSFLISQRSSQLAVVCEILRVYNCRVGEVLRASWQDFYNGLYLILPAEKHSQPVVIRDRIILDAVSKLKKVDDVFIFRSVNYHSVYSYLKKNYSHLFTRFKTKKNFKVTHAFRYANVSQLNDMATAKTVLHHNSKKSCLYYNHKLIDKNSSSPNA